MNKVYYNTFTTAFCNIIVVGTARGISRLHLETAEGKREFNINDAWQQSETMLSEAEEQIKYYLEGRLRQFSLPLDLQGTDFQKSVWEALRDIPFGETRTYGQIADVIGNPGGARAVGMANSKNPVPLIIPCHRVIGANGKLTGFAHGLAVKKRLLQFEQEICCRDKNTCLS